MSNGINLTPINPTPMPANLPDNDLAGTANTADFGQSLQQAMVGRVVQGRGELSLRDSDSDASSDVVSDESPAADGKAETLLPDALGLAQNPMAAAIVNLHMQLQRPAENRQDEHPAQQGGGLQAMSLASHLVGERGGLSVDRLLADPAETAIGGKNLPHSNDFSSELADALTPAQGGASSPLVSQLVPHTSNGLGHAASTSAPVSLPLASSLSDGQTWSKELGHNLIWMTNQKQQVAEMQLNPPNLGPLEVRVTIQNDQANLMFVSPHAAVRDVIESALPRLSSMFGENGISMGSVLVGDQSMARQQQQQQSPRQRFARPEEVKDTELGWRRGAFDLNISILA
ncbi:flagellar hook-length control protein FliK [Chitinivorax sp. PXF-14]|uniref:flagellar hook-length control protein FliK n=1 Tax=Chitinivorax sp. PXF-14 TaxID=3230488 RepID=UPI0034674232